MVESFSYTALMSLVHLFLFSGYIMQLPQMILLLKIAKEKNDLIKKGKIKIVSNKDFYLAVIVSFLIITLMPLAAFALYPPSTVFYAIYTIVVVLLISHMSSSSIQKIIFIPSSPAPYDIGPTVKVNLKDKTLETIFFRFPEKLLLFVAILDVMVVLAYVLWGFLLK